MGSNTVPSGAPQRAYSPSVAQTLRFRNFLYFLKTPLRPLLQPRLQQHGVVTLRLDTRDPSPRGLEVAEERLVPLRRTAGVESGSGGRQDPEMIAG